MTELLMTIDGEKVSGSGTLDVINPATGTAFTQVPNCSREQLDAAMDAAGRAYKGWARDEETRREVLLRIADALEKRAAEIVPLLTQEQGKPLPKATEEILGAVVWFRYTAGLEIPVEIIADTDKSRIEVRRRPLGVVAAITPWNYPLLLATWKIAPALLAGNTVVIKPSPYTPVTTLKLGEVLREVVPPGVVNVVSGGDELGAWMTTHPAVRKISFTGSVATGKKVAMSAAPDLKRVTLELGGNDAAIVLPDVEAKEVADRIFWGAFENCGQICSAIKRVYVHESRYADLVSELAERAKSVRVGNGSEDGVQIGPINNKPQLERVFDLVEDARKRGAKMVAGGQRLEGPGYFFAPTIVGDIAEGARLVDEEQFGPVLPIMPYKEVEDAVERANATNFGLSGSVWSGDVGRATEIAGRLECGTAWVNQHLAILPFTPFGGAKWSGIGVENGPWGLLGFTEIQTVNIAKA